MATNVISYQIIGTCPTGDHGHLDIELDSQLLKRMNGLHINDLRDFDYTTDDIWRALMILGKEMVKRKGATTKTQIANCINNMTITLTY